MWWKFTLIYLAAQLPLGMLVGSFLRGIDPGPHLPPLPPGSILGSEQPNFEAALQAAASSDRH